MSDAIHDYLSKIGRHGGQKSRRTLTKEQALAMVEAREKKRKKKSACPKS